MNKNTAWMLDLVAEDPVEVEIRADGTVLWVHHQGITVLRICRISNLIINDHREERNEVLPGHSNLGGGIS